MTVPNSSIFSSDAAFYPLVQFPSSSSIRDVLSSKGWHHMVFRGWRCFSFPFPQGLSDEQDREENSDQSLVKQSQEEHPAVEKATVRVTMRQSRTEWISDISLVP